MVLVKREIGTVVVVVVVAAVRIETIGTIIPKHQGDQQEFLHKLEQSATLSSTRERQAISMVGITMPPTTQSLRETQLTFTLFLPFVLSTIPEVLM